MTLLATLLLAGTLAVAAGPASAASTWTNAAQVPGMGSINLGQASSAVEVACVSGGSCLTGGFYLDGSLHKQGWVASRTAAGWGQAEEVPGLGALNTGSTAQVADVACSSAGNCVAVGSYTATGEHAFAAVQTRGHWADAREVPGVAALEATGG